MEHKINCENRCVNTELCYNIKRYFICECYQCVMTTLILNYCINCACMIPNEEVLSLRKRDFE